MQLPRIIQPCDFEILEKEFMWKVESDEFIQVPSGKLPFGIHYLRWRYMKMVIQCKPGFEIWILDTMMGLSGRKRIVLMHGFEPPAISVKGTVINRKEIDSITLSIC